MIFIICIFHIMTSDNYQLQHGSWSNMHWFSPERHYRRLLFWPRVNNIYLTYNNRLLHTWWYPLLYTLHNVYLIMLLSLFSTQAAQTCIHSYGAVTPKSITHTRGKPRTVWPRVTHRNIQGGRWVQYCSQTAQTWQMVLVFT